MCVCIDEHVIDGHLAHHRFLLYSEKKAHRGILHFGLNHTLTPPFLHTVNVEIFALYIFSLNSSFLNFRENIYTVKITIIIA